MSLFGFIIVVGVVVDDAIVTGENVYQKLRTGMDPTQAAIEGTQEVTLPVTFGVITTMVAFIPLMFFDGTWGDFAKQIPPVVAPVLLFSLLESKWILPSHLKHIHLTPATGIFMRTQQKVALGLEQFVDCIYGPSLAWALGHKTIVLSSFAGIALCMAGYCLGGHMSFTSFPTVDRQRITAILDLPDDTPLNTTQTYADRLEEGLKQLKSEFKDPASGESLIKNTTKVVGAYGAGGSFDKSRCYMSVEIMAPEERSEPGPKNSAIANRWTEIVGPIPEALTFRVFADQTLKQRREYDDEYLNLELRGPMSDRKAEIAESIKEMLEGYPGISTAWARINRGQDELELKLRPRAAELGLSQAELARQIRQAFYGEEAQRVQRGIDDIRVMVRLPKESRESLRTLEEMTIRTPRGADVPISTVAEITFRKAPTFVERNDGAEIIRIGAQPIDESVDVVSIAQELEPRLWELCRQADNLSFQFIGYVAEAKEAKKSTLLGGTGLLLALYGLLAIPFKSLVQPFFVMTAVPFGIIGALVGHIIMGVTPSYLSIFGMLALAGVTVNDSLVMVDHVNKQLKKGKDLDQATRQAGKRRFRPIMLTSLTTFLGLLPLMLERSLQAQFLIPMAISLGFGVIFATTITLYLIPCVLMTAAHFQEVCLRTKNWYWKPFRDQV